MVGSPLPSRSIFFVLLPWGPLLPSPGERVPFINAIPGAVFTQGRKLNINIPWKRVSCHLCEALQAGGDQPPTQIKRHLHPLNRVWWESLFLQRLLEFLSLSVMMRLRGSNSYIQNSPWCLKRLSKTDLGKSFKVGRRENSGFGHSIGRKGQTRAKFYKSL